jgi:putative pyoverdin transport system ATP-binding/permease protein
MSFFRMVRVEMQGSLRRLALVSVFGGLSTTLILASINAGAQAADHGRVSVWAAAVFIAALLLFIQTQHYILITTTAEIGAIIHKLRVRLMDYVRRSELLPLENIGRAQIVSAITMETSTLTQAANTLAFAAQGALLIFLVAIYVAYLSLIAFVLGVIIVGVGAALFHSKSKQLAIELREANTWENRLFDRLSDVLDGFKEVRLNRPRSDDLFEHVVEVSRAAANLKIKTQSETYRRMIFLQTSLYTLLGAVAFVVPVFSDAMGGGTVTKAITALVFIVGACFGLVQSIPIVAAASAAAEKIELLETQLREAVSAAELAVDEPRRRFSSVEFRDVEFSYIDPFSERPFKVGPLNFTLNAGDLVILTGGNGSGKSTFMKLLAGFYRPNSGELVLDGIRIDDNNYESYRSLFTAIFPDFHLFQRLYGIPDPDTAELDRLLGDLRLAGKTRLTDGEFRTVDLSSGQRRRLALIVSLLEKRPIMLLDEWAADQDPEFRRKFYFDLLPGLHRAGVTVVAISHDDRYIEEMDVPIRRLAMDEGRFVEPRVLENG